MAQRERADAATAAKPASIDPNTRMMNCAGAPAAHVFSVPGTMNGNSKVGNPEVAS